MMTVSLSCFQGILSVQAALGLLPDLMLHHVAVGLLPAAGTQLCCTALPCCAASKLPLLWLLVYRTLAALPLLPQAPCTRRLEMLSLEEAPIGSCPLQIPGKADPEERTVRPLVANRGCSCNNTPALFNSPSDFVSHSSIWKALS